jgi:hypothetical protein
MREEIDELDFLLACLMRDLSPDKDPPPRVWEAIEAKLAQGVSSGEVRPLPWRSKASAWLWGALSSVQAVLLFLRSLLDGAGVEEQTMPASVVVSVSAAPWPLYSYNFQIVVIGFQRRSGARI